MRFLLPILLLATTPALAQVSVNTNALDALRPTHHETRHHTRSATRHHRASRHEARQAETRREEPRRTATQPATPPKGAATAESKPAAPPAAPATPMPHMAAAAPNPPVLPPPSPVVPVRAAEPPPPVPVKANAPGTEAAIKNGVRVTFGPGSADLNPATEAALRRFAKAARDGSTPISIVATAAGTPADPSTPRRLSLSRALAARAVLIEQGIPSPRIWVRALGPQDAGGPADRVDVTRLPAPAAREAQGNAQRDAQTAQASPTPRPGTGPAPAASTKAAK